VSPEVALSVARRRMRRAQSGRMRTGEAVRVLPILVPVVAFGAAAVGAALWALTSDPPSGATLLGALVLLVASILAEAFPLPIEGVNVGAMSLATVFIVGAAVLYGWPIAVLIGLLTMVTVELGRRRPPMRVIYNSALYVCAALAAGSAAAAVGDEDMLALVVGALAAALAFYAVDIVLLAAVISRARWKPFIPSIRVYLYSTVVPFLIMASLTATLVVLWDRSPYVALILVGPLLTIAFYQRWLHGALVRLREFDLLKDEFIAMISHELRTPLTSVYGAAVTLQKHEVSDSVRDDLISIISTESSRLARLLDDVLWASRLDTGTEEIVIVPTDAEAIAREVNDAVQARLPDGLTLELDVRRPLPQVSSDPDKLRQILLNLVENAIKYSPDGGRVDVVLQPVDGHLRFSVRDQGIGIPADERDRIFEKFHRLDPNLTRGVSGTGLGLYICRELVERMQGEIWVRSVEGRGSTFAFELPQAD
jgi:signal transduction histidine kinase